MRPYTIQTREGEAVSPVTSTRTVFDENGVDLDTLLAQQKQDTDNTLKKYAKKTEVTQSLDKKQDKLSTTSELLITSDNILGLTDRGRRAVFDDMYRTAARQYGSIDYTHVEDGVSKPYQLNGLWLSYEEAVAVMSLPVMNPSNLLRLYHDVKSAKTHMPSLSYMTLSIGNSTFSGSSFEVIEAGSISVNGDMFKNCRSLRRVGIYAPNNNKPTPNAWDGCIQLEDINFSAVYRISFSLKDSPLLSLSTVQQIISKTSADGAAFTITVHPDVYAKLTDETNTEWHALIDAAAAKNIVFATP